MKTLLTQMITHRHIRAYGACWAADYALAQHFAGGYRIPAGMSHTVSDVPCGRRELSGRWFGFRSVDPHLVRARRGSRRQALLPCSPRLASGLPFSANGAA